MRLSSTITACAAALCLAACSTAPAPRPQPSAEALVQRQLEAYNAHDLEGFLATYSAGIEIFDLPDTSKPTMKGLDVMRERYGSLFAELPKLRCNVGNRIADGAFVVDHEVCNLGIPGEADMRAIAIYQVENGLIHRVWFGPAD